jgi:hypothetical protein
MMLENAMFFNILAPMARRETRLTKKLCNYGKGPCEERVSLLVIKYLQSFLFLTTFLITEVFLNHSGFLDHIQLTYTVGLL